MTAIKCVNVTRSFNGKVVVNNLNLEIEKGKVTALLGPNGAGKTTTISMMLGLLKPSSGIIEMLGAPPTDKKVKDKVGALLQENAVIDSLKVGELLNLFRSYYSNPFSLEELLKLSGLESEVNNRANKLSGGQTRRLNFALSIAGNPEVLFLDEPTVGMDIQSRKRFWETIHSLAKQQKTIILTTHYLEEADQTADRIIVLNNGEIIAVGTPNEIKSSFTKKWISFKTKASFTEEQLLSLSTVHVIERLDHDTVKIEAIDTDAVLREIVLKNIQVYDIQIQHGRLEDAFELLTNTNQELSKIG